MPSLFGAKLCDREWHKPIGGAGIGVAAAGALLATVWAHVPDRRGPSVDFRPGRMSVAKSLEF